MSAIVGSADLVVRADVPAGSQVPIDTSLRTIGRCVLSGDFQEAQDRFSVRSPVLESVATAAVGTALFAGGLFMASQLQSEGLEASFLYEPMYRAGNTALETTGNRAMNLLDFTLVIKDEPAESTLGGVVKAAIPILVGAKTVVSEVLSRKRGAEDNGDYREYITKERPKQERMLQYGLRETAGTDKRVVPWDTPLDREVALAEVGPQIPGSESGFFFGGVTVDPDTKNFVGDGEDVYTYAKRDGFDDSQKVHISGHHKGFSAGHDVEIDPDYLTILRGRDDFKEAIGTIYTGSQGSEVRVSVAHKGTFSGLGEDALERMTQKEIQQGYPDDLDEADEELVGLVKGGQMTLRGPSGILSQPMGTLNEDGSYAGLPEKRVRHSTTWARKLDADVYKPR